MTVVSDQGEKVRLESLALVMGNAAIRDSTRRNMVKIDHACRRIVEQKDDLTVSNVVRTLADLYPGDHPAEQSIRNASRSGESYREVVAIWRTYVSAVANSRKTKPVVPVGDDLPDIVLNQIQPEGARVVILAMRTSLRNMRGQIAALKQLTPERLIRHVVPGQQALPEQLPLLGKEARDIVAAFTDTSETASRGLEWDDLGRLLDGAGNPLSRPGLRQVLEKVAAGPQAPIQPVKARNDRRRKK